MSIEKVVCVLAAVTLCAVVVAQTAVPSLQQVGERREAEAARIFVDDEAAQDDEFSALRSEVGPKSETGCSGANRRNPGSAISTYVEARAGAIELGAKGPRLSPLGRPREALDDASALPDAHDLREQRYLPVTDFPVESKERNEVLLLRSDVCSRSVEVEAADDNRRLEVEEGDRIRDQDHEPVSFRALGQR